MGTVTIAASYGTGCAVIASAVANRLGLPLLDRAIPPAVATELDEPLQTALADDERHEGGLVGRLFSRAVTVSGYYQGEPLNLPTLAGDDLVANTEAVIRCAAQRCGAVILGRAGMFVLRGWPQTLHVRLDGAAEARRRLAMAHEGIDAETAARQQVATDRARAAYVRHFYREHGRWEDPANYHLVLDSTVLPADTCVKLIVAAARAHCALGTRAPSPAASRR
ncbi:MAG TPA: cytidylate kinase-like family protein [Candidatus Dormibacteraeota bacterium]|nr:cytidylate kinase-like family protein [Candidatus Dormibacteraeota bacterium]